MFAHSVRHWVPNQNLRLGRVEAKPSGALLKTWQTGVTT